MAKLATCDRTGKQIPLEEAFLTASSHTGEWFLTCMDAPERSDDYNIQVKSIVRSPAAFVDWMAHLNEKTWFDAGKFLDFFTALRKRSDLFGSLQ